MQAFTGTWAVARLAPMSQPLTELAARKFELAEGEQVEFACRPARLPRFALYLVTLGLYEFWRRATFYVVTNRRTAERAGLITRTETSLPLFYVQDATIKTFLAWGAIYVSTAGGEGGAMATRWIGKADAQSLRREILDRAHAERPVSR